jgi:FdhD protein
MADPTPGPTTVVETVRWSTDGTGSLSVATQDTVVTEEPLEIRLVYEGRGETVSMTMRTPGDDASLAVGFLFTEGILTSPDDVARVDVHGTSDDHVVDVVTTAPIHLDPDLRRQFLTNSSCGVCGRSLVKGFYASRGGPVRSDFTVSADRLGRFPAALRLAQRVFDATGGLHAAGLFDREGGLAQIAEDIGRHNAVDKVVGRCFRERRLPASDCVLQVSGRASFEIVQKAAAAGIPVVSAVSAPSSLAVSAADRFGVTLAGFVRGDRFNLYAHPERVVDG